MTTKIIVIVILNPYFTKYSESEKSDPDNDSSNEDNNNELSTQVKDRDESEFSSTQVDGIVQSFEKDNKNMPALLGEFQKIAVCLEQPFCAPNLLIIMRIIA